MFTARMSVWRRGQKGGGGGGGDQTDVKGYHRPRFNTAQLGTDFRS